MTPRQRYEQAHRMHQDKEYPSATKDFGHIKTTCPDIKTANGLTRFIINFLSWTGARATRINTQGQHVTEKYKGRVVSQGFRPSQTRKGTADISCTINGRSVMIEIKINDKPSQYQLDEQVLERAAGGVYEFISTPEQFFELYDRITNNN